ncbi:MAG TPA: tetratricopeptide repeat protein [Acidimicrobiia bacterium]|nr:tetratricopeptide repeat protein [Acidimicrobiia bacterium]
MPARITPQDALLSRPRLEALLDEAASRRLTALTGGAGVGKTTLIRQWLGRRPAAWHTATPGDGSLSVLARGILDKVRLQVPDLSPDLFLAIEGGRGPETEAAESARADSLAAELCRDLEGRLVRDLYLVLDDVHLLGKGGDSVRLIAALSRNAPERLHLVTASRDPLPFPTSRMRIQKQAGEISADQLVFTLEEVALLLHQATGEDSPDTARAIYERTAGWPVAVVLAMQLQDPSGDATSPIGGDTTTLFEYLAEEVIGAEPPDVLSALQMGASLPWITEEMAARLAIDDETAILFDPQRRNVYVTPAPNNPLAVSISPLVRDFLLERHRLDPGKEEGLLRDASAYYEEEGAVAEAMECLLALGSADELARYVSERGEAMLAAGMARRMVEAIDLIPDESRGAEALLYEGEARQVLGDWEGATACYEAMAPGPGEIPARLAWRLGFLSHMRGDVKTALDIYGRGRRGEGDLANEAALLGWAASAHWLRGERDEAQALANEALALARQASDSRALATAHTVLAMVAALDGDRAGNDVHYLRALEHAERARDVVQTIRIRSNRGSHFLEEGDYDNALAELDIALRLADMTGFQLWRAMSLSNRAQVLTSRGRLEESVADLEQAREIFRRMGSILESYPLAQMGDVYALRGDMALARAAYEEAIRLGEEAEDLQALVPAQSGLARVLAHDDPERAGRLADEAARVKSVIGHARALLAQGFVALARGWREEAGDKAVEAAGVARARQDLPVLAEAMELEAAADPDPNRARSLLEQARRVWEEIDAPVGVARVDLALAGLPDGGPQLAVRAAAVLRGLGAKGLALRADRMADNLSERDPRDVSIRTLGGFAVSVAGQPVPASAWQSRVAREIVGMLAANRGRPLHREIVIERLWPDEDPAKAGNRLSVALSTIRSVFDPDRSRGADHYLSAARESLALDLDHVEVDIEAFFDEARRGRALLRAGDQVMGLSVLRSAEARYLGEFLEDHPYADWATARREEARTEFMSIARILAEADAELGDHDASARWYMRILEQDSYNEPAHLALVSAMVAAGRHGTARRLYGIYVSRMGELEVEPAAFPG